MGERTSELTKPANIPEIMLWLKVISSEELTPICLLQNSYDANTIEFINGVVIIGAPIPL